ncbi:hypothetical protein NA643_02630 [Pseudomonas stutzeri]|nr:hypothetical protein [Stutzerimonas stutzeri]MCQ4277972.1 hypothetical protein [Stutzerimonas stutzeri]
MPFRSADDAHAVPKYLPEQGLANRCQVNKIYGTTSRFSNIRDELYLLVSRHGCLAQNSQVHVAITVRSASGNRTKNVGQPDVRMLP